MVKQSKNNLFRCLLLISLLIMGNPANCGRETNRHIDDSPENERHVLIFSTRDVVSKWKDANATNPLWYLLTIPAVYSGIQHAADPQGVLVAVEKNGRGRHIIDLTKNWYGWLNEAMDKDEVTLPIVVGWAPKNAEVPKN